MYGAVHAYDVSIGFGMSEARDCELRLIDRVTHTVRLTRCRAQRPVSLWATSGTFDFATLSIALCARDLSVSINRRFSHPVINRILVVLVRTNVRERIC